MTNERKSYIYYFKCRPCQLEFVIFSWESDWSQKFSLFCPECGKQETAFLRVATSDKVISSIVYSDKLGQK